MEERIVIIIREDGSRMVVRNINNIGNAAHGAQGAIGGLTAALNGLMAALAVNRIRQWLDTWTAAVGKVNIFTSSVEHTNMVMERLVNLAIDSRQPLDATVNSFHQMTLAASALGASQNDLLKATETVNKVFAIQGTTAQTARGGIIQFGQAMTEGIVRAQEYNSMINAMPLLLKIVAENLEETGGRVSGLRKMMLAGELTSKKFFEALLRGQDEVQKLFDRSGRTIGQAFTNLDTAFTKFFGQLDQRLGISRTFFNIVQLGVENIEHLGNALLIIGSPLVVAGLLRVGQALTQITIAAFANPWIALAGAITAAATALTLYKDQIILVQDQQITLGDFMKAGWDVAVEKGTEFANFLKTEVPAAIEAALGNITGFNIAWDDILSSAGSLIRRAINLWIGWFASLPKAVATAWAVIPGALYNIFAKAFNDIKALVSGSINSIIGMINPILNKAGIGQILEVSFEKSEIKIVDSWETMVGKIKDTFSQNLNTDWVGEAAKGIDELTKRAAVYAEQRRKDQQNELDLQKQLAELMAEGGAGDDFAPTKKGKKGKTPREEFDNPRSLENNLRRLLNTIQPLSGAVLEYERAQRILNAAVEKGRITEEQRAKFLELTKNHYRDIVDPIGAVIRELGRENTFLQLNVDQRQIEAEMYERIESLRQKGVITTSAENAAIRQQIELRSELQKQAAAQDALYQSTQGSLEAILREQQALNEAYANGAITQEYYNSRIADTNVQFATLVNQLGNGNWTTIMVESLGQVMDGFTTLASGVAGIIGNTFTQLTDGISNSIAAAITKGEDLRESLYNVAQTIVTQLISAVIKLGVQWAIQQALGTSLANAAMAASIAQAQVVAGAWAPAAAAVSLASFGSNSGPAIAGMFAANAAAQAMSMVGFKTGGQFEVGGAGGADSQLIQFMATPGEMVNIRRPGDPGYDGGATAQPVNVEVPVTVNNYTDPKDMIYAMDGPEGDRVIMNAIERNSSTVKKVLS